MNEKMEKDIQPKVVVIGAGLGGLSAAIALAGEGFDVTIIEKNDKIGGKLNVLKKDGFTFDLGPSILTMPHIFDSLFEAVGKNRADYVQFQPVDPHWRNFFEDGAVIDLSPDTDIMRAELEKLGPKAAGEFERFLAYSRKLCRNTEAGYFAKGLDTFWEVLRFYGPFKGLFGFDVFRSMDQGMRKHISHPKLAEILNYFAKYVGSSPYDAPAVLNLLPAIQFEYGLWYVQGGMYQLALALQRLAGELGIKIRLNTEVDEILWKDKQAYAVKLGDDEIVATDVVVSNMEVIPAMKKLLHRADSDLSKVQCYEPSCSGLVLHLGVNRLYPQLAHHNFFYSDDSQKHFNTVFHAGELSNDPTIYVVAPTKTDPQQAPEGCEVIKVLPHIPHINPSRPIAPEDYQVFRENVLVKLERMGLSDLRKHIVTEECWTPYDIESRYYSNQGSIYGVVSDRYKNLGFKTPQRSLRLENLYFAGGSVNPGGGMPMVVLSGLLVRDKIMSDRVWLQ